MSIDYQHRKFGGIEKKKKKDASSAAKLDNLRDFVEKNHSRGQRIPGIVICNPDDLGWGEEFLRIKNFFAKK